MVVYTLFLNLNPMSNLQKIQYYNMKSINLYSLLLLYKIALFYLNNVKEVFDYTATKKIQAF